MAKIHDNQRGDLLLIGLEASSRHERQRQAGIASSTLVRASSMLVGGIWSGIRAGAMIYDRSPLRPKRGRRWWRRGRSHPRLSRMMGARSIRWIRCKQGTGAQHRLDFPGKPSHGTRSVALVKSASRTLDSRWPSVRSYRQMRPVALLRRGRVRPPHEFQVAHAMPYRRAAA
jgi:hypothetical protein